MGNMNTLVVMKNQNNIIIIKNIKIFLINLIFFLLIYIFIQNE